MRKIMAQTKDGDTHEKTEKDLGSALDM